MIFFNLTDNTLSIIESTTTRLQPNEVHAVKLLSMNLNKEFNTLDLLENGISSPAQCICRLKKKGAIIQSIRRTITDESGKVHKGIACYTLVGWK
jgi:hypothetical protein